jgi:taurine dioxygenase
MGSSAMGDFTILPMTVGAEVAGLDLDRPYDERLRQALYAAWLDFGVLIFRDVDTAEKHIALSRCFGELEIHPFPEARAAENPLFIEIGGAKQTAPLIYDETELRVNRIPWHRDTAYTPALCKGAMLRMLETPPVEGETLFADTALAYDELPNAVKQRLDGLEYKATLRLGNIDQTRPGALWKTAREATIQEDAASARPRIYDDSAAARYPSVVHPAVLTHPESGRRCIFLSPTYVDRFLGLTQPESDALLEYLVAHQTQPRYVYKHRWTPNGAILWDNRRFMHAAVGNRPGDRRRGLRTTLAGQLNTGRYYEQTAPPPGGPALVD